MAVTQKTETTKSNGKGVSAAETLGIGMPAAGVKTKKVDPFESIPTFRVPSTTSPEKNVDNPEKKSYMMPIGSPLCGCYVQSREVHSEKLLNGGSMLHIFRDAGTNKEFGVWGVGYLDAVLPRLRQGQYVEITYQGTKSRQTKFGKKECHEFEFATREGDTIASTVDEANIIRDEDDTTTANA